MNEILCVIAIFAAFFAGAWLRKPFVWGERERAERVERPLEDVDVQLQNMLNYGLDGYEQKEVRHED